MQKISIFIFLYYFCMSPVIAAHDDMEATGIFAEPEVPSSHPYAHKPLRKAPYYKAVKPHIINQKSLLENKLIKLVKLLHRAVDDDAKAQENLEETHKENKILFEKLKFYADKEESWAEDMIADFYQYGDPAYGIPHDKILAFSYYKMAAQKGDIDAQYALGEIYEHGSLTPLDLAKARIWYERAAAQGDDRAQVALALMYEKGRGGEVDLEKAHNLLQASARQNNRDGEYYLGLFYMSDDYGQTDRPRAAYWLEHATALGSIHAQTALGLLYTMGSPTLPPDLAKGAFLLERSAKAGDKEAISLMRRLGYGNY